MATSSPPNPRLRWLCFIALAWAVLVLQAGGFTTSIRAGMAFLDWPLSNGSINPPGWLTEIDKFAEHSHRLTGMMMGLITIGLGLWLWLREDRAWLRLLGGWAHDTDSKKPDRSSAEAHTYFSD